MPNDSDQAYKRTSAYSDSKKYLFIERNNPHFEDLLRSAIESFWVMFFPIYNNDVTMYELPAKHGYWKWAGRTNLMRLLTSKEIMTRIGKRILLLKQGRVFLESATKQIEEETMKNIALELALEQIRVKDKQIQSLLDKIQSEQQEQIKPHLRLIKLDEN